MINEQDITPIIEIGETPDGYITYKAVNNAQMSILKLVGVLNVITDAMLHKVPDCDQIEVENAIYDIFNRGRETRGNYTSVTQPKDIKS